MICRLNGKITLIAVLYQDRGLTFGLLGIKIDKFSGRIIHSGEFNFWLLVQMDELR